MNLQKHTEPDTWFHVTNIFTPKELGIIGKYLPQEGLEINGKREHHTSSRTFITENSDPEIAKLFAPWQDKADELSDMFEVDCTGGRLRVELITDAEGMHLTPHIDIKEKLFTFQIYLGKGEADWGTTLYKDWDTKFYTVPFVNNTGWATNKDADVIHGVLENRINGTRTSLIINYVKGDWRDTDQLFYG
jgi:hypothetical protein